ncbi:GNAT family N-acetyltransferase [Alkalibacterium psychrotolerans]
MEDIKVLLAKYNRLETERLILRPVTLKDAEDMFEYASDEETTYYVFDRHESLEETEKAIVNYFVSDPFGKYGIELKETGKMIGTIDLRVKGRDKRTIMGYTLNKAYHGKGYMTEAGKRLLALGFETLGLECIAALHDERNAVSGKVMERLGMTKEGTLRHVAKWKQGEWFNDVYYSILKSEYDVQQRSH